MLSTSNGVVSAMALMMLRILLSYFVLTFKALMPYPFMGKCLQKKLRLCHAVIEHAFSDVDCEVVSTAWQWRMLLAILFSFC